MCYVICHVVVGNLEDRLLDPYAHVRAEAIKACAAICEVALDFVEPSLVETLAERLLDKDVSLYFLVFARYTFKKKFKLNIEFHSNNRIVFSLFFLTANSARSLHECAVPDVQPAPS